MKEQTFSSSYPGSALNEYKANQNEHEGIEHCCCPTRRRALSLDLLGNEVGCITGYRNKKTIRIVALRGNVASTASSVRLGRSPWCPFHRNENANSNNVTMEGTEKIKHKEVIMIWNKSVEHAKHENWDDAFNTLLEIMNYSAKMRFNLGQIAWALQKPDLAKENFLVAVEKDPHMALAHFQLGMVNYRLHRYNESRRSYDKAKTCLRGNKFIDYRQLGFVHKLYECEILYNLALTYATMMNTSEYGLELLGEAGKVAIESRHTSMIEKAQKQLLKNELYEPYVVPGNQLFRPPKSKVDNLQRVDYLGKHKVVSELSDSRNNNNKDDFKLPGKPGDRNTFCPINDDFSSDEDSFSPTPNSSSPTPSMVAKMTHKDTLATWHEGVKAFDKGDLSGALDQFNKIVDPSAKILYNIGILQKTLGQLDAALLKFQGVVASDPYLAIGHFQLGVVYGLRRQYNEAWEAFGKTQEVLRGNKMIDYKQLGLQCKLHKCEVLHNEAWTYNEQNSRDRAEELLDEAVACKADARHDKIDESKRHFSNGYSFQLFEPPKPLLFRPPKSKIDNLERKDYLGKAKIVAKLPSHRGGSTTPPPASNTSANLGISLPPPRSKTPTPASSGQKDPTLSKPPPVNRASSNLVPALPARPLSLQTSISSLATWEMPTVTVDKAGSTSPDLPRRPPPLKSSGFDAPDGRLSPVPARPLPQRIEGHHSPPPNRPVPSPNRTSPIPNRPVPSPNRTSPIPTRPVPSPNRTSPIPTRPVPSPNRTSPIPTRPVPQKPISTGPGDANSGPKLCLDAPPSRALPSPNRTSPIQDRPLPQRPRDNADAPPARQLPSPSRSSPSPDCSSPLPDRPLPSPPGKAMSSDLPDRALPQPPKARVSDLPNRPLPDFPTSDSGDLAQRPVPPRPGAGVRDLPGKAFPPQLVDRESDVPSRLLPPAPKLGSRNDFNDSPPDLPSRPPLLKSKTNSMSSSGDEMDSPDNLPSRPIPPVPRTSSISPTFPFTASSTPAAPPKLPARPSPVEVSRTASNSSSASSTASEDLPFRPVPAPPASDTNDKPQLPPRVPPAAPKLPERPTLSESGSPSPPGKPLPRPPGGVNSDRASSPGLPDLPPPPPPSISKERSPVVPRRQIPSQEVSGSGGDKKAEGHKAKLVKIITDSPPVVRKAAAVTVVQKEGGPAIPARPGNDVSNNKPTLPAKQTKPAPVGNKPLPVGNKPKPVVNKPEPVSNKPAPINAFQPQPKPNGGAGKKKTALVIASHDASGEGEVSVSEGDLISIIREDGDWLEVEVKGEKGRLPRTCVKSFSKPGIQVNFH